jgi:hypothetical protein
MRKVVLLLDLAGLTLLALAGLLVHPAAGAAVAGLGCLALALDIEARSKSVDGRANGVRRLRRAA